MLNILELYNIQLFSILLLLIIYILNKLKKDSRTFSMKLFYMILFTNILLLIMEPMSFLSDKVGPLWIHYLNYALDFLIIIFSMMITGFWASYIDYKFFKKQRRIYKRLFYQHITIIAFILLIINFFTPILFQIDIPTNTYERGYLFGIRYVLIIALYGYVLVMMFRNKNKQNSKIIMGVLLFLLFPIIGAIIQSIYQNLYFQFTGLAMGVLVVFVFLETTSGNRDYLTNLYTRRVLDETMDDLLTNKIDFTIVMIDLDHFKDVNDQYGHQKGDELLVEFSHILLKAKQSKSSLITRLGGDEFLGILLKEDHDNYLKYIENIKQLMKESQLFKVYENVDFSYGLSLSKDSSKIDKLLMIADQNMYQDKHKSK